MTHQFENGAEVVAAVKAAARSKGVPVLRFIAPLSASVNGHRRFRKSGHLKFPSLAGGFVSVISRDGDRAFPLLAGGR
ncbi:MAG: hypothetical protein U9R77_13930, partial [Pseudomonadota bacterium]|nr:hypothetical protein [Pseudomonadota bacterium]